MKITIKALMLVGVFFAGVAQVFAEDLSTFCSKPENQSKLQCFCLKNPQGIGCAKPK